MKIFTTIISFSLIAILLSQCLPKKLTATDILTKSIYYHDPHGNWSALKTELQFDEIQPSDSAEIVRKTKVWIDNKTGFFKINRGGNEIHGVKIDSCFIEKGDFTCERAKRLRNYYLYLWGLPMKLKDPGTNLSTVVTDTLWQQTPVYKLKVDYEKDKWSYYFDKEDFKLIGYSFVQQNGGGEDILLKSELSCNEMKIPKERSWYTLDGKFLGMDILTASLPFE